LTAGGMTWLLDADPLCYRPASDSKPRAIVGVLARHELEAASTGWLGVRVLFELTSDLAEGAGARR